MDHQLLHQQLLQLTEVSYQKFSKNLLPGVENILGIRHPVLRNVAKQISKEDWQTYLQQARDDSFEETMLQGMVIGCVKTDFQTLKPYIENFVPKISNWSVCDNFCAGLKIARAHPQEMWDLLLPYFQSQQEFELRFAIVMLLDYYIDQNHIESVLSLLDHVDHDGYYVKMAVAWAISICYIHFSEETMSYLQQNQLDDFTYHKALQKICESFRVTEEDKKVIRSMRRLRQK